jgi:hypothetical protein
MGGIFVGQVYVCVDTSVLYIYIYIYI